MRDLALFASFLCMIVPSFIFPHVGVLVWSWFSFMNPHREIWILKELIPFVQIAAIATAIAWFWSREPKRIPINPTTLLVALFSAWITMTTLVSLAPEISWHLWDRNIKTMILVVAIIALIRNRTRIDALIGVIVLSLGYYGVKGGLFVLLTGGNYRVLGPEDSMIHDNNALALALVMCIPLMNYLRVTAENPWFRRGLFAAAGLMFISVVGTYSRGGLIAMIAMALFLAWKSNRKLPLLIMGFPLIVAAIFVVMPEQWYQRASTITEYEEDQSLQGRFEAWETSVNVALARPFVGGGFSAIESSSVFMRFNPDAIYTHGRGRAAHSIYFQVLGDHGFVALFIFLTILAVAWWNASRVIAATKNREDLAWANTLARMIQVSLVGYIVGGSALSLAYYDVALSLIAILANLRALVREAPAVKKERIGAARRKPASLKPQLGSARANRTVRPGSSG